MVFGNSLGDTAPLFHFSLHNMKKRKNLDEADVNWGKHTVIFLQFACWEHEGQGHKDNEEHAPFPNFAGSSIW